MRSSQGLLRTTNRTHVDVAVLAPAQGSSQCIYFNKIGMSSTVKPHSRPFDHCGFWSQAMSPLITWPPSSALRRLQEGFVILCFDLFVTSPRQIPPSLPSCQVQSNFSIFKYSPFTNTFAACGLQRVQRPLLGKVVGPSSRQQAFRPSPKILKVVVLLNLQRPCGPHLCSVHFV